MEGLSLLPGPIWTGWGQWCAPRVLANKEPNGQDVVKNICPSLSSSLLWERRENVAAYLIWNLWNQHPNNNEASNQNMLSLNYNTNVIAWQIAVHTKVREDICLSPSSCWTVYRRSVGFDSPLHSLGHTFPHAAAAAAPRKDVLPPPLLGPTRISSNLHSIRVSVVLHISPHCNWFTMCLIQ